MQLEQRELSVAAELFPDEGTIWSHNKKVCQRPERSPTSVIPRNDNADVSALLAIPKYLHFRLILLSIFAGDFLRLRITHEQN
jgi:hypothetical protein